MKQGLFNTILLIVAFTIALTVFYMVFGTAPKDSVLHDMYQGGPLIAVLMGMSIMVLTYVVERLLSLRKAQGKSPLPKFLTVLVKHVTAGDFDAAVKACDAQRGSLANIVRTGLNRFQEISGSKEFDKRDKMTEVKRVLEEATMLEMPILEKNLIALSTIASISTMVGLLGTVIGMIRSFAALARAGSADAVGLSRGISEALFNTAGGIGIGIAAIVAYNFFTTKIDNMTYMIDEASKNILENLETKID
ncbi:MAG: MotA/TolQ/ExbB proton channel family protein [Ignavibacteriales bacterium]|nr:MotA/TolQ/ExbB proton channel family protein [Ignavibacteriales bacterium]